MVRLGQKVKHRVSGFTGVAVSRHEYLSGCARISVMPKCKKKDELPEEKVFDELELEVLEKKSVMNNKTKNTGGPKDHKAPSRR